MVSLPTGTVTFLFTDIEGSTRLLQQLGDGYPAALGAHIEIVRRAISEVGGVVVSTEGDSFFAVFTSAREAVRAAAEIQRGLSSRPWPTGASVRVRAGIHTGEGTIGGDNYVGLDVHRAARIAAAGHGGQVLVSGPTAGLVENSLPAGTSLRSLGEFRLKDLTRTEMIYQLVIEGLPADFPPLKTIDLVPGNLPVELTSFIGRAELAEIVNLVQETRLVTLTGPGGTGKTRMALQVASELMVRFADGVWFVALAAISDPDLVTSAVGAVLGVQPSTEDPDRHLTDYLRTKEILLILDNFEQIPDAAPRVAMWLQGAPCLKVLVTSRGPLRISGEHEFPIPSLALPSDQDLWSPEVLGGIEAVALFIERATAARPDFSFDSRTAPVVAEIVSRLEGLPLAIELAAARIRLLSLEGIRERLNSRLGLLTGGARDLPERQRTLRSAIEWSYDLLDDQHRRLFERLGVFIGGFTLEQAEEISGPGLDLEILEGLGTLADQSLVGALASPEQSRFLMLETIREYALERLQQGPEIDSIRRGHALAFLRLAERAAHEYTRNHTRDWLDRSKADHDNFRAAVSWAIERGEAEIAQRLTGALWRFWQMRGYLKEGRQQSEASLEVSGGTPTSLMTAHEAAGGLAYWQADMAAADQHYLAALNLAREIDDPALIAHAIYNLASPRSFGEGTEKGLELIDEGLALAKHVGDRELIGRLHWMRGGSFYVTKRPEAALVEYLLAAEYLAGTTATFDIAWTERMIATVLIGLGRPGEAEGHLRASLQRFVEAGDISALPLHVSDFVHLALAKKRPEKAIILAGAAAALQAVSETRLLDIVANEIVGLDEAIELVGQERAEKLAAEGQSLTVDQILSLVNAPD